MKYLAFSLLVSINLVTSCNSAKKMTTIAAEPTDPKETEVWTPIPVLVKPGASPNMAPSDAIMLFDGKGFGEWLHLDGSAVKWENDGNSMTVKPKSGDIRTKRNFGSCQLHVEWKSPSAVKGEGQGRGNSGIFLQERYEVQVLDNYDNRTYSNGQASAVYKQTIPLVNACKAPGEWQMYDIIYDAPKFDEKGVKTKSAYVTVIHNGVITQNHTEITGSTEYIGYPKNIAHGEAPIKLQDHGDLVSYRNIWIRRL